MFVQQLLSRKLCCIESSPTLRDGTEIGYEFDDTAFAQMLKDYSVFNFVLRVTFWNETKG